jgi:hypothetical protein
VHFHAIGTIGAAVTDVVKRRESIGYYDVLYIPTAEGWRIKHRVTTLIETRQSVVFGYETEPAALDRSQLADESLFRYEDIRASR